MSVFQLWFVNLVIFYALSKVLIGSICREGAECHDHSGCVAGGLEQRSKVEWLLELTYLCRCGGPIS